MKFTSLTKVLCWGVEREVFGRGVAEGKRPLLTRPCLLFGARNRQSEIINRQWENDRCGDTEF